MPALKIRCPATGQAIPVGIEVEPDALHHIPEVTSRVQCPLCKGTHAWTKADAFMDCVPASER